MQPADEIAQNGTGEQTGTGRAIALSIRVVYKGYEALFEPAWSADAGLIEKMWSLADKEPK
jgi:hypothetical protein